MVLAVGTEPRLYPRPVGIKVDFVDGLVFFDACGGGGGGGNVG